MNADQLTGLLGVVVALVLGFGAMAGSEAMRSRARMKRRIQPFAM